jgi:hypothetical protein
MLAEKGALRDFQKIKEMVDFSQLDAPHMVSAPSPNLETAPKEQMILRMLVRPKYGALRIPAELEWLRETILSFIELDREITGIADSWCYVTVRRGPVTSVTDDEWHFDGASFRTDIIPERNYVWVDKVGPQYKTGQIDWPVDFDPNKHNLFSYAEKALKDEPIQRMKERCWGLMSPFVFHRRDPATNGMSDRTFIRISFPDIEGRDINNSHNPLLPTPFFGRNPVRSFRNRLRNYGE